MIEVTTYTIRLYMGGDIEHAKQLLRSECYRNGRLCVTIEPTTFIYVGGEESGFVVGLVNYPRYPEAQEWLLSRAKSIAEMLMPTLNQRSALLVASDRTFWLSVDPPGART